MYLFEIAACALVIIIYMVVQYWCKFQATNINNIMQDHAKDETATGYTGPSELVLGNNVQQPNPKHDNHNYMQIPVEETSIGSTAELAF